MRKVVVTAILLLLTGVGTYAQNDSSTTTIVENTDKYKVETNRFWSNWFISVGGGAQIYFGDHDKERIASNHAIHFLYGHVQFAGDDTLHLFRLVPMLVANLSAFFMIACNLQVGRIFMGIRISVLRRSENVRVDKGRVENMKKKKPGPFGGERTGLYNQFVNHL